MLRLAFPYDVTMHCHQMQRLFYLPFYGLRHSACSGTVSRSSYFFDLA
jgi:hypothetical protein